MLGEGIEQLCVFAVFFVLGVGFSAIYIFFVGLTKHKLAAIIFDCLFGAIALYVIWKVNLEVNNGEFRAFLFVGLAIGAVTTFVTCKTTLDKLSAMLYNLFTNLFADKSVDKDGKTILQKVDIGNIRSSSTDTGVASVHATGNVDSNVVAKRPRRRFGRSNRKSKARGRRSETKTSRNGFGRLRNKMGSRAWSDQ